MISVVVPAYNEQEAISPTVASIRAMLDAAGWSDGEIVVVDDGSTDETAARAEAAGARVVRHPTNAGYGRSLKDGILGAKHDLIAITDADGTYPIDRIPALAAKVQAGFDMAVGARQGAAYRESALKHPLRLLLKFLVEFTAGQSVPDPNSGLRVFRRRDIVGHFPALSQGFSFTTSATLAYMSTGKFVVYEPIPYAKRVGTTKVRLLRDSLRTLQFIVQAILFHNPLKLFLCVALVAAAFGVLAGLAAAAIGGFVAWGFAFLGFLVAALSCLIGLLAEMMRQIWRHAKERGGPP
jgi:glycosyltransferase involved in cell wall biosynthesis